MLTPDIQLRILQLARQQIPVKSKKKHVATIMTSIVNSNGYPMVSETSVYQILRDHKIHTNPERREYLQLDRIISKLEEQVASDPNLEADTDQAMPNSRQATGYRNRSIRTTRGGARFSVKGHYISRRQRIRNRFKSILKWFMSLFSKQEVKEVSQVRYEVNEAMVNATEELEEIWYEILEAERVIGKAQTRTRKLIEGIGDTPNI